MLNAHRVAILILNWNNFLDTKECLDSLRDLTYKNYQIILVDNGSTDGSGLRLKQNFPDLLHLTLDENLGFAGGNNHGLVHVLEESYPYVLLLNNDTEALRGDFLTELIRELQMDEEIGAIGPKVRQPDGSPEVTILPYPTIRNTIQNTRGRYTPDLDKKQEVDSITGCCVLVRTETIKQIGFLDENYFMYAEETEWFYRMRKAGWKILYHPIESVLHKGGSSSKKIDNQSIYIERRANVIYTLVKGQYKVQAFFSAGLMLILLFIRILKTKLTKQQPDSNPFSFSMIWELISAFQRKWALAAKFYNRK